MTPKISSITIISDRCMNTRLGEDQLELVGSVITPVWTDRTFNKLLLSFAQNSGHILGSFCC